MNKLEYLLCMLKELPPDFEKIEEELKANNYTPKELTAAMCHLGFDCFLEYTDFENGNGRKPLDEELNSTYVYDICKLFLKYGLDPNMVLHDERIESTVMYEIYGIDKPYVAADTLRLMLENGGDPMIGIEGEPLWELVDFDIYFDVDTGEAQNPEYQFKFDSIFHFWLVLKGFIAENEEDKKYINHEKYTYKIFKNGEHCWDFEIVEREV